MTSFKKSSPLLLLSAAIIALTSCTKTPDNQNLNTTPAPVANTNHTSYYYDHKQLNSFFKDVFPIPLTVSMYAGTARQFITPAGTIVNIYPNSFKDNAGNIITNDSVPVTLKISDAYGPGAVIASRSTSNQQGNLFSINGQVYLYANLDGHEIYMNRYGVAFNATGAGITNVDGYGSTRENIDSIFLFRDLSLNKDAYNYNDSQGIAHFTFLFDEVTGPCVACGKKASVTGQVQTNVFVTVPDDSYNSGNTTVFLVFPDKRTVTYLTDYNSDTHTFELNPYNLVPLGQNMEVVVLSYKDGLQYGEVKNLTTTINMNVPVNMGGKGAGDITTALNNL